MKLSSQKILPLDSDLILSSENKDHQPLLEYFRLLIKEVRVMYSDIANIVNINDDIDSVTSGITASTTQTQGQ
jgi:hypothetical protein